MKRSGWCPEPRIRRRNLGRFCPLAALSSLDVSPICLAHPPCQRTNLSRLFFNEFGAQDTRRTAMKPSRREILRAAAWLSAAGFAPRARGQKTSDEWNAGELAHLIPAASHERFQIKCSFRSARSEPPELQCGDRRVLGRATDSLGRFFSFDVAGLSADTEYELRLVSAPSSAESALRPLGP